MAFIESTAGGTGGYFRDLWQKSVAREKEETHKALRAAVEYSSRWYDVPAKRLVPGFGLPDRTVGVPYAGGFRVQESCVSVAMPPDWPQKAVPACAIADAAFSVKPEIVQPPPVPSDTDRMWDLLVLAARTSRYGE